MIDQILRINLKTLLNALKKKIMYHLASARDFFQKRALFFLESIHYKIFNIYYYMGIAYMKIGLIGDYDSMVPAHQAIPLAIKFANEELGVETKFEWIPTDDIQDFSRVEEWDGIWCVPASPYKSMKGALLAIEFARKHKIPFLGTCGGFQHAIIEYARNVLGWIDAEHAETSPEASRVVISPLSCSLVEATDVVYLVPDSKIANAYGEEKIVEGYRCRFGLNQNFVDDLTNGALKISAKDKSGEVRAIEIDGHPFFVATLFQPERAALKGNASRIVSAFVKAVHDLY